MQNAPKDFVPTVLAATTKEPFRGDRRSRIAVAAVLLAVGFGAAACTAGDRRVSMPPLPAGAIPYGDDLYMVPVAPDAQGCMQYRMHSPTKAVVQVMFYADGKGGFTPDRNKADCTSAR